MKIKLSVMTKQTAVAIYMQNGRELTTREKSVYVSQCATSGTMKNAFMIIYFLNGKYLQFD